MSPRGYAAIVAQAIAFALGIATIFIGFQVLEAVMRP